MMGSLANSNPHLARARALMLLACFVKQSWIEKLNPKYSQDRLITIFWESQMDYKPKIDFNRICTGMPALVG